MTRYPFLLKFIHHLSKRKACDARQSYAGPYQHAGVGAAVELHKRFSQEANVFQVNANTHMRTDVTRGANAFYALVVACATALLVACGSTPVEPGHYRVERGDTLAKIARQHGQTVGNLARWNQISNPNRIEVGQVLRVTPPVGIATSGPSSRPAATAPTGSRATPARPTAPAKADPAPPQRIALVWPAQGKVIRQFNGSSSKGIAISAPAGSPVRAAANGTVAYAGNKLRGYGNLIILKHSSNFITIYAHNRKLLVVEGQRVRQGQNIAEMGDTDTSQVQLYFELRHDGQPTNPVRMLPAR